MKKQVLNLFEHIEVISTITCSKCSKKETRWGDDYGLADSLYKEGWYATGFGNVYCPECQKKRKKVCGKPVENKTKKKQK